jgi:hypothetical protein
LTRILLDVSSSAAIFTTAFIAALLAAYMEAVCGDIVVDVEESIITEAPSLSKGIKRLRVKYKVPGRADVCLCTKISVLNRSTRDWIIAVY